MLYFYDAYCGWCYGWTDVMQEIDKSFGNYIPIEVISGGMVITQRPVHISATAEYIKTASLNVEKTTGAIFGKDFMWHIENPALSDWYPSSEKPAIALCIMKEIMPEKQLLFAKAIQKALFLEGRDLTDDAAYNNLLEDFGIDQKLFMDKLNDPKYFFMAEKEFNLCKKMKIASFPCLLLQTSETKFFMLSQGYTPFETVKARLERLVYDLYMSERN